jgi:hypothetical protein
MAGSPLSIGTNKTTVFNADKTDFKTVTTYEVYNDKTGQMQNFATYAEAATYTNNNGGSAALTPPGQQPISYAGSDPDIQAQVNERALDQGLRVQNEANATGFSPPAPVSPATDPQAGAGEIVAEPLTDFQRDGNTDGYGSPNETQVPASEVRYSAKDLEALAARNEVDAGDVDTEVGIVEAQLYRDEGVFGGAPSQGGVSSQVRQTRNQETNSSLAQMPTNTDWRVILRLAPGATYLYNAADAGLLQPLKTTNGVIFPYTPAITTFYKANYSNYDLTHSNYRGYFYQNSYIDAINMNATFTAQSTSDAAYVLAVIHFFRSVTKMFYGQDAQRGSPPPLVFLSGLGDYQFNNHPCLVQSFNYVLPADVDYISSGSPNNLGLNLQPLQNLYSTTLNAVSPTVTRLAAAFLPAGAQNAIPAPLQSLLNNPTYVPSKIDIQLTLLPVQSRQQVSRQFSLKGFANGQLLKGGFW